MSEQPKAPNYPEYSSPAHYHLERELIRQRALNIKNDVEDIGRLCAQAEYGIGPNDRQMVLQEMDVFRAVYHYNQEEMDALFKRLDWTMPAPDEMMNPGVPSEQLVNQVNAIEFNPPFNIAHEFNSMNRNETIVYSSSPDGYGISVSIGRDGVFHIYTATEDEIDALSHLVRLLEPEYRHLYEMLINPEAHE